MIYQGQEHGFSGAGVPDNREALWQSGFDTSSDLYQYIALMNQIRRHAINVNSDYLPYNAYAIYADNSTIAFRKGEEGRQVVILLNNGGSQTGEYNIDLSTAYIPGTHVTDVVRCANYTVNEVGQLSLPMAGGLPHVLFPSGKMNGSELCGFGNTSLDVLLEGGAVSSIGRGSSAIAMIAAAAVAMALCLI